MNHSVKFIKMWGNLTSYNIALKKQHSLVLEVSEHPNLGAVLGYEHPNVITLGLRSCEQQDLLLTETELQNKGIEVIKVNRGGEATFHNPGQLVVYPILHLPSLNMKVKDYICYLQKTTIKCLESLNIKAHSGVNEPGVYTDAGKIAFIGVKVSKGVTYHGISININNDLDIFKSIKSCGVQNQALDKVDNYSIDMTAHQFFGLWFEQFAANIQPSL